MASADVALPRGVPIRGQGPLLAFGGGARARRYPLPAGAGCDSFHIPKGPEWRSLTDLRDGRDWSDRAARARAGDEWPGLGYVPLVLNP